jgi:hypothetical protein
MVAEIQVNLSIHASRNTNKKFKRSKKYKLIIVF